jgi:hypothetical protein
VPDKDSSILLKDCERTKLDNPFNLRMKVSADKHKEKEKEKEKASAVWEPTYETWDEIQEGSSASLMAASTKLRLKVRMIWHSVMKELM